MVIVRDAVLWGQAELGEAPVPLGDRGDRRVGEIQAADGSAMLPALVDGFLGPSE